MNDFLVSTGWLEAHLNDPNVRVIDIRGHVLPPTQPPPHYFNHREDYVQSHIPGALFVDWVHEITDPDSPHHAQIAKPERYAALMSRLGVSESTFVVSYDDANSMFAARVWWSLNYYGHSKAAVLDGGWNKWQREGRPTTAEIPTIPPSNFVPRPNPALYRSGDAVLAALSSAPHLVDVRSPEEFRGETARARRMGHIPGAVNVPRATLTNADGTLPPPEALRAHFAAAGIHDDSKDIITYCNAGVSASFAVLALRAAGFNAALYDGSWKEWGSDDDKPIAT